MRQYTEYQVHLTFKMRLYFPPRFSKLHIPDPLVLFTLVAYEISHQKEVNPNHREIINKFEMSMMKLHEKFAVPITPKLHIVFEHLSEYFEMSGKTLRKKTDQTVEATHSKFDNFIRAHNYKIRDVESEKAGEYLLKAVKHFNSYNLGKID